MISRPHAFFSATKTAEMNELDSHLEKTSEIFKIGSVEKKLQPLKKSVVPKVDQTQANTIEKWCWAGFGPLLEPPFFQKASQKTRTN